MSLITDALRTAQRERNETTRGSTERRLLEGFFPYGSDATSSDNRRRLVLVTSAVVVLALAGGLMLYLRLRPVAHLLAAPPISIVSKPPARVAANVPPKPKAAPPVVQANGAQTKPPVVQTGVAVSKPPEPSRSAAEKPPAARGDGARSTIVLPVQPGAEKPTAQRGVAEKPPAARADSQPPAINESPASKVLVKAPANRPGDQYFADAFAAHQAGNLDRAQELYEKAIRSPGVTADVYNDYGALLMQRGDPHAAVSMYRLALSLDQSDVNAWINLGSALDSIGIHAEATSAFQQALKLDASNVAVKLKLADQYGALGATGEQRRLIEEVTQSAPKDPAGHYQLAALLERLGDNAGAIREFDAFLDLGASAYPAETMDQIRRHVAVLRARSGDGKVRP